jgi:hypothetical protein
MVPNACDVWFRDVGLEPRTSRERTEFVLLTPGCAMCPMWERPNVRAARPSRRLEICLGSPTPTRHTHTSTPLQRKLYRVYM